MKLRSAALALLFAVSIVGLADPSGVPFARVRIALYESEWEIRVAFDDWWGEEALAARDEAGSLYALWASARVKAVIGDYHTPEEAAAIKALRATTWNPSFEDGGADYAAFQVPVCAPTLFPGSVGYGAHTGLRCTLSAPTHRPIISLDGRVPSGGNLTGYTCSTPGDSTNLQTGGFSCETIIRTGFRIAQPEIEGTRGGTSCAYVGGNNNPSDSLVLLGYMFGAAAGERYDHRACSYLATGAQPYVNWEASNMALGHMTTWDQQCNTGTGLCTPDEQKMWRCGVGENNENVYTYSIDRHGNSGDDLLSISCSSSTLDRSLLGPAQIAGTQMTCLTGAGEEDTPTISLTIANSACIRAGHRVPEGVTATVSNQSGLVLGSPSGHGREFVNWIVYQRGSRAMDVSAPQSYARGLFRSVLYISNRSEWFNARPLSRHASSNTLFSTFWLDSLNVAINLHDFAIDYTMEDGFNIDAAMWDTTVTHSNVSFWHNQGGLFFARCQGRDGLTGFPCFDTLPAGDRQIDSTAFQTDVLVLGSNFVGEIKRGAALYNDLIVNKRMGNRYRVACDMTIADSLAHNPLADSLFALTASQVNPPGIGDDAPSMQAWWSGYPTGLMASNAGSTYSPCAKNPHGVPDAAAERIVAAFGGTADDVDWDNDADGDSYPLWAEAFAPSDPTLFSNPDGSQGVAASVSHSFVIGADSISVLFFPLDSLFGTIWVDTASLPVTTRALICPQANPTDSDSALVSVLKGAENGGTPLDSMAVDSVFTNHGPWEGCSLRTLRSFVPN